MFESARALNEISLGPTTIYVPSTQNNPARTFLGKHISRNTNKRLHNRTLLSSRTAFEVPHAYLEGCHLQFSSILKVSN